MQELLLAWYGRTGRELPWRETRDPYAILVSEVMLQQYGVESVELAAVQVFRPDSSFHTPSKNRSFGRFWTAFFHTAFARSM